MVIHVVDVGRLRTWQLRESEIWPNNFVEASGVFRSGPQGDGGALLILALLANTSARPRCAQRSLSSPPRPSGGGQVLQ